MSKLTLSTKKSIHEPIEVEIDGKIYKNRPFSRALFDEIKKYEKPAKGGNIDALYNQVRVIYNVPLEVLNKLDIRDINTIINHTMKKVWQAEVATVKEQAEKNAPKSGDEESA